MHFTIVFNGQESSDISYGLLFVPCPVWFRGGQEVLNLHPANPQYQRGDLRRLLEKESIVTNLASGPRQAAIVVHSSGHGSAEDLALLQSDLREEGFSVHMLTFSGSRA
jgi:hypothetical protein